jgi:hypothetical protein
MTELEWKQSAILHQSGTIFSGVRVIIKNIFKRNEVACGKLNLPGNAIHLIEKQMFKQLSNRISAYDVLTMESSV